MGVLEDSCSFLSYSSKYFLLNNGLRVVFLPTPDTDVLALQMWVKTGSIHEGRFLGSGISHFVEHMVFKGTNKRTYADIFKETQAQGAKINAYTSFDRTVYTYDGCTNSLDTGLDILGDMLCGSVFPEEELIKERDVILREIDMSNDDPDDRLSQLLFENAFQQHPYHYPIIGIRSIFESLTRKDLIAYWQERYAINNMILIVAGNLDVFCLKKKVEKYLGHYLPKSVAPVYIPQEPFQLAERFAYESGDYQLTRGAVAFKIPGVGHKDGAKLQVLASVLGSGESSLLYQKLREEKKLVYSIDASSWMAEGQGLFWIQYTCMPEKRQEVESFLQNHLCDLVEDYLTENAINKAYNQAIISELDTRKTVSGRAHHVGWAIVCLGDENYPKHYLEQLRALTANSVKAIVRKYFKKVSCTTVSLRSYDSVEENNLTNFNSRRHIPVESLCIEGVRVIIQQCPDFPKTHIQALFSGGALYEPSNKRGLTQLLSTLLTKDTKKQTALQIAETVERLGGQFNSFSGSNYLGLSIEVLSKDIGVAANILKNALSCPQFKKETFDNELKAQWAELQEMQDDVFYAGFQKIRQQFFKTHPYCIGQLGNKEGLSCITYEDCVDFYKKLIVKYNGVLSVITSLSKEKIIEALTPICQGLSSEISFNHKGDDVPFDSDRRVEISINKEQAMVFKAFPVAGLAHEDFYVGEFLEELFNGLSSSFVEEVREKRGLAYTVGATRLLGIEKGMFCLFAGTQAEQAKLVESEMCKGIQRILDHKISTKEFEICRSCLKVNRQLRLQTLGRKAFQAGYNALIQLPSEQWLKYNEKIDAITLDQFYSTCEKYLKEELASTLLLMPNQG